MSQPLAICSHLGSPSVLSSFHLHPELRVLKCYLAAIPSKITVGVKGLEPSLLHARQPSNLHTEHS